MFGFIAWRIAFRMSEVSLYLQVCAPTGAGKTNIAMISVLHEVFDQWANTVLCFCLRLWADCLWFTREGLYGATWVGEISFNAS